MRRDIQINNALIIFKLGICTKEIMKSIKKTYKKTDKINTFFIIINLLSHLNLKEVLFDICILKSLHF